MKTFITLVLVVIAVLIFEDGKHMLSTSNNGVMSSQSKSSILPGADAWIGLAVKAGRAIHKASRSARKGGAEHTRNKRPSSKARHQKGQARKKRDQDRAANKRQKGGKDGSKRRGNRSRSRRGWGKK